MIRVSVALLFFVLIVSTVQVGLGESKRASVYYVIYFLLAIAAIIGIYMYRMISLHKEPDE
jgi:disulfide bond formation protein DsbB